MLTQRRGELKEAAALAEGGSEGQVHENSPFTGSTSAERSLTQYQSEVRRSKVIIEREQMLLRITYLIYVIKAAQRHLSSLTPA
ncbi:hypothetical protein V2J80_27215, partial [Pseudomonas alliivorans]|nr:hypothetical protein [Pseudomonas alliivorans]